MCVPYYDFTPENLKTLQLHKAFSFVGKINRGEAKNEAEEASAPGNHN